jgi:hypothetical protein
LFTTKDDYQIIYLIAKRLGFADELFKNITVDGDRPVPEDILREINRGGWSTGSMRALSLTNATPVGFCRASSRK